MKKSLLVLVAAVLVVGGLLSGCGSNGNNQQPAYPYSVSPYSTSTYGYPYGTTTGYPYSGYSGYGYGGGYPYGGGYGTYGYPYGYGYGH